MFCARLDPHGPCCKPSTHVLTVCRVPTDIHSLNAFNCQPVRFEAELSDSLEKDFPEGLNSSVNFHFLFVDIGLIDEEGLKTMRKLQPDAKFVFMCDSMNLAKAMKRFDLTVRLKYPYPHNQC